MVIVCSTKKKQMLLFLVFVDGRINNPWPLTAAYCSWTRTAGKTFDVVPLCLLSLIANTRPQNLTMEKREESKVKVAEQTLPTRVTEERIQMNVTLQWLRRTQWHQPMTNFMNNILYHKFVMKMASAVMQRGRKSKMNKLTCTFVNIVEFKFLHVFNAPWFKNASVSLWCAHCHFSCSWVWIGIIKWDYERKKKPYVLVK